MVRAPVNLPQTLQNCLNDVQSTGVEEQSQGVRPFVFLNPEGRKGRKGRKGRRQYRPPNICDWPWAPGFGKGKKQTPRSVIIKLARLGGIPRTGRAYIRRQAELKAAVEACIATALQKAADDRKAVAEEQNRVSAELRRRRRILDDENKVRVALEKVIYLQKYRDATPAERKRMRAMEGLKPSNILKPDPFAKEGKRPERTRNFTGSYLEVDKNPEAPPDLTESQYDDWCAQHTFATHTAEEQDDNSPDLGNVVVVNDDHIDMLKQPGKRKRKRQGKHTQQKCKMENLVAAMKGCRTSEIAEAVLEVGKGRNILELIQTLIPLLTSDQQSEIFSEY
jgi:hypothetical protein